MAHYFHVFPFALFELFFLHMKMTRFQFSSSGLSSHDLLCTFYSFLKLWGGKRCPYFASFVSRPLGRHAARTETMTELGAGTSCDSTAKSDNEDTHRLLMGTSVKKVAEIEKKYDEYSKPNDSSDSVREHAETEMYTTRGRG